MRRRGKLWGDHTMADFERERYVPRRLDPQWAEDPPESYPARPRSVGAAVNEEDPEDEWGDGFGSSLFGPAVTLGYMHDPTVYDQHEGEPF